MVGEAVCASCGLVSDGCVVIVSSERGLCMCVCWEVREEVVCVCMITVSNKRGCSVGSNSKHVNSLKRIGKRIQGTERDSRSYNDDVANLPLPLNTSPLIPYTPGWELSTHH